MNKPKPFKNKIQCLEYLESISSVNFKCGSCGAVKEPYQSKSDRFIKICRACSTKKNVTHDTIFHDTRFGLVKAFGILDDYVFSNNKINVSEASNKYGVTRQTIYRFLELLKKNEEYTKTIAFRDNKRVINKQRKSRLQEEKLLKYIINTEKNLDV